ncbi:hypothetical protein B1J93_12465 [Leptospira kirschneri serovar Pomona]|uniref:Uncharacterized protein n=1 Tax=Leptospira kirschneri serovar Pomona TaxID=561005 RepID=A0A1T1DL65_9LEPT|nr:hypothetical protein B1J93_12465 [Leptospira kirschneri serovar Pomona]
MFFCARLGEYGKTKAIPCALPMSEVNGIASKNEVSNNFFPKSRNVFRSCALLLYVRFQGAGSGFRSSVDSPSKNRSGTGNRPPNLFTRLQRVSRSKYSSKPGLQRR